MLFYIATPTPAPLPYRMYTQSSITFLHPLGRHVSFHMDWNEDRQRHTLKKEQKRVNASLVILL
jgi:hypothetical protein